MLDCRGLTQYMGALKVAESGLRERADLERLATAGFDAFLIGESLLLAEDPGSALRGFLGEKRTGIRA